MKRLLAVCLVFLMLPFHALALIECDCGKQNCICFIQMGDEGVPAKVVIGFLAQRGICALRRGA